MLNPVGNGVPYSNGKDPSFPLDSPSLTLFALPALEQDLRFPSLGQSRKRGWPVRDSRQLSISVPAWHLP